MKKILAVLILISFNLYSLTQNEENFLTASENGNTKKVKELLALGADINIQDYNGFTALMWAIYNGHTETAKELIKAGADVNIQDDEGWTALDYAEKNGHNDTAKLLKKNGK